MNNWSPMRSLLVLVGACLGAIVGFALFRAREYSNFVNVLTYMSVLGATIGFVAGTFVRERNTFAHLSAFSRFALSGLILCAAIFFVVVGITTHTPLLSYNGLIFACASIVPLVQNTSAILTTLTFAGIGVVSFAAFAVSDDRSWLIVTIPAALAACLTYLRSRHERLAS